MGLFTEYKIYKNLYNLVNKKLIHKKEKAENIESPETRLEEQFLRDIQKKMDFSFRALLFILVLLFVMTFFTPFSPLAKGNILFQKQLYQKIFQIDR